MTMRRAQTGFLMLLLGTAAAFAQARVDCNALQSSILNQKVRYCVMLPPGYDAAVAAHPPRRYPVLYFLHGLGDNEQGLFKAGGMNLIEDLQRKQQISDFLIVSPEGRANFYINSADGHVLYSDFFIKEFIPYIEKHYPARHDRAGRAISGISMGGYGALRFAFAYPELFSSVSAQSAALMTDTPQQLSVVMRSGSQLGELLGAVYGNPIDVGHWNANSPFVLARHKAAQLKGLAIFFDCGRDDEFGFEKGAEALHRQLQEENVPHEYHLYPGNHGVGFFLEHMGETFIFHSNAFAGKHPPAAPN